MSHVHQSIRGESPGASRDAGRGAAKHTSTRGDKWLVLAVVLNILLTVAQIIGGALSGSLSLIADALHNLNDAVSLAIAVVARRIARKPADDVHTYGHKRAETIAAVINLTALIVAGLFIAYEGVMRLFEEREIDGWIVIIVAGIALVIDLGTAALTHVFGEGTLNFKAAMVHKLADAFASVGVIVAGTLIILYEWYVADLIAALAIATYIIWQGIALMRPAVHVLMESVPEGIDLDSVVREISAVPGVVSVHQVRLWLMHEEEAAFDAHIVVDTSDPGESERMKEKIKRLLHERFDVTHTTLEMERPAHKREADAGPHGRA